MLTSQRNKIDQLDRELVRLLETRMELVTEIAEIKNKAGIPVLDEGREVLVLEKVTSYVTEPAYQESIRQVYQEILTSSKQHQAKVQSK